MGHSTKRVSLKGRCYPKLWNERALSKGERHCPTSLKEQHKTSGWSGRTTAATPVKEHNPITKAVPFQLAGTTLSHLHHIITMKSVNKNAPVP